MRCAFLVTAFLGVAAWGQGQATSQRINKDQLIRLIREVKASTQKDAYEGALISMIREKRLAFPVPPETEKELAAAGASPKTISVAVEFQLKGVDLFDSRGAAPSSKLGKDSLLRAVAALGGGKTASERAMLEQDVIRVIQSRRLDFTITAATEQELARAGASPALISAARKVQLSAADILLAAQTDFAAGQYRKAAQEAETSAAIEPSLGAYRMMADAGERSGDIPGSQTARLKMLALGGEITIPVLLAPPGENFRKVCEAKLVIGQKRVSLSLGEQSSAAADCRGAEIHAAEIVESGPNEFVGKDRQAFHVLLQSPQGAAVNLCLAPQNGDNKWALDVLAAARKP